METVKEALKRLEEQYTRNCEENERKGIKCVPWKIVKRLRLYLEDYKLECKSSEIIIDDKYQIISMTCYKEGKYMGTVITFPEDTSDRARGRADKCIIERMVNA